MKFFKQCVLVLAWAACPVFANAPDLHFPVWHLLRVVVDHGADLTPEQAWQRSEQADALRLVQPHQVLAPANSAPHWAAWSVPVEYAQQLPLW